MSLSIMDCTTFVKLDTSEFRRDEGDEMKNFLTMLLIAFLILNLVVAASAISFIFFEQNENREISDKYPKGLKVIYIDGMPCVFISEQVDGSGDIAISCDWSKYYQVDN